MSGLLRRLPACVGSLLLLLAPGELGGVLGDAPRVGAVALVWLGLAGVPGLAPRADRVDATSTGDPWRAALLTVALCLPTLVAADVLDAGRRAGTPLGSWMRLVEVALLVAVLAAAAHRARASSLAHGLHGAYWLLVLTAMPLVVAVGHWGRPGGVPLHLARILQASPLGWAWSGAGASPAPLLLAVLGYWLAGVGSGAGPALDDPLTLAPGTRLSGERTPASPVNAGPDRAEDPEGSRA